MSIDWNATTNHNNKIIKESTKFEEIFTDKLALRGGVPPKKKRNSSKSGKSGKSGKERRGTKRKRDDKDSSHPMEPVTKRQKTARM